MSDNNKKCPGDLSMSACNQSALADNGSIKLARRDFLAGMGIAAAALLRAPDVLATEKAVFDKPAKVAGRKNLSGVIDVHHHILPPGAPEALQHHMAHWSASRAIDEMDKTGVEIGIAYPGPILEGDNQQKSSSARIWNEFGASLGQSHSQRFGLFASLPFPHVNACLAEIDFALDHLGADGFGISTSYDDLWLGDESLWPIYEKLNSRAAVVFVHPHNCSACIPGSVSYNRGDMGGSWIEWPMNTARTIMSLMTSGTLRRYPRIRFIFAHGGGVMPLLINRVAAFTHWEAVGEAGLKSIFPNGIEHEFKTLHFECAQACSVTHMAALRSLVPDTNILFGSDYPFFPLSYGTEQLAQLDLPMLSLRAIARDNALRLFPASTVAKLA